jgi:hypothetical protein
MAPDAAETREAYGGQSPETVDRILVGACGAIWLLLVAMGVIATMALIDLGRGHPAGGESERSSWPLYTVIAVSAVILLGAIPLLLRARRNAVAADARLEVEVEAPVRPIEARTEKLRVFGTAVDPYERPLPDINPADSRVPSTLLNRLWLRGTVSLVGAIGLALIGVAAGTYLLATSSATAAWVALGFAGAVTVAMPAILVGFQRKLGEAVEEAQA